MPEPLLVLGADGSARRIAALVDAINGHDPVWDLIGYLADEPAASRAQGCRVLGSIDSVPAFPAATLVCGSVTPVLGESRLALVARLGVDRSALRRSSTLGRQLRTRPRSQRARLSKPVRSSGPGVSSAPTAASSRTRSSPVMSCSMPG